MTLPENYTIIHRDVKHARLRVNEDGSVHLFVPNSFTDEEVSGLTDYLRANLTDLKKRAAAINPLNAFMGKKT